MGWVASWVRWKFIVLPEQSTVAGRVETECGWSDPAAVRAPNSAGGARRCWPACRSSRNLACSGAQAGNRYLRSDCAVPPPGAAKAAKQLPLDQKRETAGREIALLHRSGNSGWSSRYIGKGCLIDIKSDTHVPDQAVFIEGKPADDADTVLLFGDAEAAPAEPIRARRQARLERRQNACRPRSSPAAIAALRITCSPPPSITARRRPGRRAIL